MKHMRRSLQLACLFAALTSALPLLASNLDHLPPDTKWVIHMNMAAIKKSGIGQHVQKKIGEGPGGRQLDLLADMLNFDPRKDLNEATVFGPDADESHAVLVVNGKVDGERLKTFVEGNSGFEKVVHDGVEVLSWVEEDGERKGQRSFGRVLNNQYVVIGSKGPQVAAALKALDGGKVLAKESELLQDLQRDAVVMAAASAELAKIAKADPNNPMLQQAKSFQMSLREKGEDLSFQMGVQMENPETAKQLMHIAQGGLAMLQLHAAENQELQALLTLMDHKMTVDLSTVKLNVLVDQKALIEMMEDAMDF